MTEELLIKFLNDQCTDEELEEVTGWIKNDALNTRSKDWAFTDWKDYQRDKKFPDYENYGSLLDKIHHKINISGPTRQLPGKPAQIIITWLTRAAALFLLPVLVFLFYTLSNKTEILTQNENIIIDSLEIVTPVGSQTVVFLSDGSEVYLNHGSKLKYPQKFSEKDREVTLSGEGYFKVAHNPEWPFVVKTGKLSISALGTTFNVLAYPDENYIETTLVEGKVKLEQSKPRAGSNNLGTMVPGQHVKYNIETEKVESAVGDIEKYIAWKDGKLIFKNESIVTIANRLSRWYNVEFEIRDTEVREFTYTATFVDETVIQILDLMCIATPIKYKTLPRNKLSDGTFSKQKIIIEKK